MVTMVHMEPVERIEFATYVASLLVDAWPLAVDEQGDCVSSDKARSWYALRWDAESLVAFLVLRDLRQGLQHLGHVREMRTHASTAFFAATGHVREMRTHASTAFFAATTGVLAVRASQGCLHTPHGSVVMACGLASSYQ